MTYQEAKAHRDTLEAAIERLTGILNAFPKGPMNLTPDRVKATPKYREARAAYVSTFQRLRSFNSFFVKTFAKEIRQERRAV